MCVNAFALAAIRSFLIDRTSRLGALYEIEMHYDFKCFANLNRVCGGVKAAE